MTASQSFRRRAFAAAALAASLGAAAEAGSVPAAARKVISGSTVRAELGPVATPLPLALSNFLLDHPDLSAFIASRHKIAPYRIERLGARRWLADDGEGTRGVVTLIEATEGHRLYYGEGVHRGRFLPDILAEVVIDMGLGEAPAAGPRARTITTFRVWVRLKSRFFSGLVKAFGPFLRDLVVRKFGKAFLAADAVGRLLARDHAAVAEDVRAFPGLSAEDRAAFLAMVSRL